MGKYPRKTNASVCKNTGTRIFVASLFVVQKMWEVSEFLLAVEWLNSVSIWYSHIIKCGCNMITFLNRSKHTYIHMYIHIYVCVSIFVVLVGQLCLTLCDAMGCSPSGSSVHGILQVRILEWVAIPFSKRSSWPRDGTQVSRIAGSFFTIWATREAHMCIYIYLSTYLSLCLSVFVSIYPHLYLTGEKGDYTSLTVKMDSLRVEMEGWCR